MNTSGQRGSGLVTLWGCWFRYHPLSPLSPFTVPRARQFRRVASLSPRIPGSPHWTIGRPAPASRSPAAALRRTGSPRTPLWYHAPGRPGPPSRPRGPLASRLACRATYTLQTLLLLTRRWPWFPNHRVGIAKESEQTPFTARLGHLRRDNRALRSALLLSLRFVHQRRKIALVAEIESDGVVTPIAAGMSDLVGSSVRTVVCWRHPRSSYTAKPSGTSASTTRSAHLNGDKDDTLPGQVCR